MMNNFKDNVEVVKRQEKSPCHEIIYTLQLKARTYEYEGNDVIKAFESEMETFATLSPQQQIKRFFEILEEYTTTDEVEMQHYVDFHHLLKTILTFNKKEE